MKNICRTLIFRAKSLRQSVAKYVARVKTRKLLQICTQVVTRLLSSRYQDVFALLVPSCCDKSGTSCYHLVTRLMTVTDLLQVVPTRLIKAVRKLVVNNLLRVQTISDLLEQLVAKLQDDNNFFQTCHNN